MIGAIYNAATNPELWPDALADLAQSVGGETTSLRFADGRFIVGGVTEDDGLTADWLPELEALSSNETIGMRISKPNGAERHRLIGAAGHGAGLMIESRSSCPFTSDATDMVRGLLPHLACALQTNGSPQVEAVSMLDQAAFGAVVLDTSAAVRFLNKPAWDLLERGGLRIKDGGLQSRNAAATAKLRSRVAASVAGASHAEAMPRTGDFSALHIAIVPLRNDRAVMLVTSPEDQSHIAPLLLQSLLGLTPAQAKLTAAIVAGLSVRDAAARFGIVQPTAATHVKHILARTGVSSQAALVRLVLTSPLAFLLRSLPGADG